MMMVMQIMLKIVIMITMVNSLVKMVIIKLMRTKAIMMIIITLITSINNDYATDDVDDKGSRD